MFLMKITRFQALLLGKIVALKPVKFLNVDKDIALSMKIAQYLLKKIVVKPPVSLLIVMIIMDMLQIQIVIFQTMFL